MKFFLVAATTLQLLFVANTFAQNELKEKLKSLESSALALDLESQMSVAKEVKLTADFDDLQIGQCLDNVISFVVLQKENSQATFDKEIKPFLDAKLIEWNMFPIDFSDDEEMIYDSFVKTVQWQNAIALVQLYEDFIVINYKDLQQMKSILRVFWYVKKSFSYMSNSSESKVNQFVISKLNEEFQSYNAVNWIVFAMHPGAMLLWLTAIYAWDYNKED